MDEIQELILQEIDGAIRNSFQMDPAEFTHENYAYAVKQRNRVAKLFGAPATSAWELTKP
jgi:hypothetical protein